MGKVKVSQLFKVIICAVTLYTLGFDKIITLPGSSFVYEILIAAIGVLLALYVKNKTRSNMNLRMQCKALSNYLMIYLVIILIEMIYSVIAYGYNIVQLLIITRKYFYAFYSYPIVYIFTMDDDMYKFTKTIYWTSMFLLGIKFIVKPVMTTKEAMEQVSAKKRAVQSVLFGIFIGFICGFVGAGGGMMMLLILTSVLGYELKTAVGTSVFIMTFTAYTGAVSHFAIEEMPIIVL